MELSLDDDISSWSFSASSVAYFLIYSGKNEVVNNEQMKSSALLGVLLTIFSLDDMLVPQGADLGEGCRGYAPPPPKKNETFLFVLGFKICSPHQSVMPFLSGAPSPKKNPVSAPVSD